MVWEKKNQTYVVLKYIFKTKLYEDDEIAKLWTLKYLKHKLWCFKLKKKKLTKLKKKKTHKTEELYWATVCMQ